MRDQDNAILQAVASRKGVSADVLRIGSSQLRLGDCVLSSVFAPNWEIKTTVVSSSTRGHYIVGTSAETFQWFLIDSRVDFTDMRSFVALFEKVVRPREWTVLKSTKYVPRYNPPEYKDGYLRMIVIKPRKCMLDLEEWVIDNQRRLAVHEVVHLIGSAEELGKWPEDH